MTTTQVLDIVRNAVKQHTGDEQELLDALCEMSEDWHAKLDELLDDEDDEDDVDDFDVEVDDEEDA